MNPKETTEYIKLRVAAIAFLEAEKEYNDVYSDAKSWMWDLHRIIELGTRLDAARSVLWDVINDKDLTKQS